MLTLALTLAAAQAACPEFRGGPMDAAFAVTEPTRGSLIVELRVDEDTDPAALEELLAPLGARGVPATILVDPDASEALRGPLRAAREQGHEVGLWLEVDPRGPMAEVSYPAFSDWWRLLRASRKAVRRTAGGRVDVVGMAPVTDASEAAAEQNAVRTLLPTDATGGTRTRRARLAEGQIGRTKVVPPGPYPDRCGATLPEWSPAAFDRVARYAPAGAPGRVHLPVEGSRPALLGRWLDEVLLPSKVQVTRASRAQLRASPLSAPSPPPAPDHRRISEQTWRAAAQAIARPGRLPRSPAPGLSLTEAFQALHPITCAGSAPSHVPLPPLGPPVDVSRSALPAEGRAFDPAEVRAAACEIGAALGAAVPALVEVGGVALTSGEFLRAMALTALGQAPRVGPAPPPDPFAPGAGWGVSGP